MVQISRRAALALTAGAPLSLAQGPGTGLSATEDAPEAVVQWIRRTAVPLLTPSAGHGFDDMAPLKTIVGDARIVALGEATHGTREFFQIKHRMLEFLVTEMGFSIFSLEANLPEAYRMNRFVLDGEGDPEELLKGLYAWVWDTEEVLEMVRWMREYNRSGVGRVEFTGFDMQTPTVAMEIVRDFVAEADPEYLPAVAAAREKVQAAARSREIAPDIALAWEQITKHLESLRPRPGLEWAAQNARIVQQGLRTFAHWRDDPAASMALRDASMAANVEWILSQSEAAKIVLWAHNWHVMTGPDAGMGATLRKRYGDQLRTFGFAFNQGSFRAMSMNRRVETFDVGPAPPGGLDAALAASGVPLFVLDLRAAPGTGPVAEWLGAKQLTRNIFQAYSPDAPGGNLFEQGITEKYDCLFFVERTSATRPNP